MSVASRSSATSESGRAREGSAPDKSGAGAATVSVLGFAVGLVGHLVDEPSLVALGLMALVAAQLAGRRGPKTRRGRDGWRTRIEQALGVDLGGLLLATLLGIVGVTAALSVGLELVYGRAAGTPTLDKLPATALALLCGAGLGAVIDQAVAAHDI